MFNSQYHYFSMWQHDNSEHVWHIPRIWRIADNVPAQSVLLAGLIRKINKYISTFTPDDWVRVKDADMNYPIIVSTNFDEVIDGCHRCVKAALLGWSHINVKYIDLPEPCYISTDWSDWPSKIEELMGLLPFPNVIPNLTTKRKHSNDYSIH